MLTLHDFAHFFEKLAVRGFTIRKAEYWNEAFGSWVIEFSSREVAPHRLSWDGRDRWLYLQCERPQSERKPSIPPDKLRTMSYEDGVFAKHSRDVDAWKDKWIGEDEREHSLDRALEHLGDSLP